MKVPLLGDKPPIESFSSQWQSSRTYAEGQSTMYNVSLSPDNADILYRSIEQARSRLQAIETGKNHLPMRYSARLSWEILYEVREMLRLSLGPATERDRSVGRSRLFFSQEFLGGLTQSIEQVMADLLRIEMSEEMALMRSLAQRCRQTLEDSATEALETPTYRCWGDGR